MAGAGGELPRLPTDVVMLNRTDGVLAGDAGPPVSLAPGAVSDLPTGVIERTRDGSASWRRVFSARLTDFTWVGKDGSDLVAAGFGLKTSALVLARSSDGGFHWTLTHPRVLDRFGMPSPATRQSLAFSGRGAALAAPQDVLDSAGIAGLPDGVMRSADDGRTWRVVRLPDHGRANGEVSLTADGTTAYVTGESDLPDCPTALWRSVNAGATWKLVRGACSLPDVFAVAFSDAQHGIVGGGYDPVYSPLQFIARTSDGGAHWQIVWRDPRRRSSAYPAGAGPPPIVAVTLAGARTAWAVPGGTHLGAAGAYVGDALVSTDGGERWTDTHQVASAIGALASGIALAVAPIDPKAPLAALALTNHDGAHWTQIPPPHKTHTP